MPGAYEKPMHGPRFDRMVERVKECRRLLGDPSLHHHLMSVELPLLTIEVGHNKKSVEEFCYAEGLHVLCEILKQRKDTPTLGDVMPILQEFSGLLCKEMNPFDDDIGYIPLLVYFLSERHKYYVDINWMPQELTFMKMWIEAHLALLSTPWTEERPHAVVTTTDLQPTAIDRDRSAMPTGEQKTTAPDGLVGAEATESEPTAGKKTKNVTCSIELGSPPHGTPSDVVVSSVAPSDVSSNSSTAQRYGSAELQSIVGSPLPLATRLAAVNTLYVSLLTFPPHRVVAQMAECFHTEGCTDLVEALRKLEDALTATAKGRRRMAQLLASVAFFGLGLQVTWELTHSQLLWASSVNLGKELRCPCGKCELYRRLQKVARDRDEFGVIKAQESKKGICIGLIEAEGIELLAHLLKRITKEFKKNKRKCDTFMPLIPEGQAKVDQSDSVMKKKNKKKKSSKGKKSNVSQTQGLSSEAQAVETQQPQHSCGTNEVGVEGVCEDDGTAVECSDSSDSEDSDEDSDEDSESADEAADNVEREEKVEDEPCAHVPGRTADDEMDKEALAQQQKDTLIEGTIEADSIVETPDSQDDGKQTGGVGALPHDPHDPRLDDEARQLCAWVVLLCSWPYQRMYGRSILTLHHFDLLASMLAAVDLSDLRKTFNVETCTFLPGVRTMLEVVCALILQAEERDRDDLLKRTKPTMEALVRRTSEKLVEKCGPIAEFWRPEMGHYAPLLCGMLQVIFLSRAKTGHVREAADGRTVAQKEANSDSTSTPEGYTTETANMRREGSSQSVLPNGREHECSASVDRNSDNALTCGASGELTESLQAQSHDAEPPRDEDTRQSGSSYDSDSSEDDLVYYKNSRSKPVRPPINRETFKAAVAACQTLLDGYEYTGVTLDTKVFLTSLLAAMAILVDGLDYVCLPVRRRRFFPPPDVICGWMAPGGRRVVELYSRLAADDGCVFVREVGGMVVLRAEKASALIPADQANPAERLRAKVIEYVEMVKREGGWNDEEDVQDGDGVQNANTKQSSGADTANQGGSFLPGTSGT